MASAAQSSSTRGAKGCAIKQRREGASSTKAPYEPTQCGPITGGWIFVLKTSVFESLSL